MSGRIWLIAIMVYAAIGIVDGARDFTQPQAAPSSPVARLAVAFCAGLFWPIDIVARPLLMSR